MVTWSTRRFFNACERLKRASGPRCSLVGCFGHSDQSQACARFLCGPAHRPRPPPPGSDEESFVALVSDLEETRRSSLQLTLILFLPRQRGNLLIGDISDISLAC